MTHDLKSWPASFRLLLEGRAFEVRQNDRNFALGDHVHVREFLPGAETLTGRTLDFVIDDVAPFILPNRPDQDSHYVILLYRRIRAQSVEPVQETPPRPRATPSLELWAKVVSENRVMQIVEDERGEQHQVTGAGMADGAQEGQAGRYREYPGGARSFEVTRCPHVFTAASLLCQGCGMPSSFA